MRPRLTLTDRLAQQRLQRKHIIMLEHPDTRRAQPNAESDRGVVQFVRDDEAALVDECGDRRRVGSKAHTDDHGVFRPDELGHEFLRLNVQIQCTRFQPHTARGNTIPLQPCFHGIGDSTRRLSEPEIVVRRNVQRTSRRSRQRKVFVEILGNSIKRLDRSSRDTRHRSREAVVHSSLESTSVEGIEIRVQRGVALSIKISL